MMKRHKIVALVALICSFGAVNAMHSFKYFFPRLGIRNDAKKRAGVFVASVESRLIESLVGKKLPESARRGRIYTNYRFYQPTKYVFTAVDGAEVDFIKESINSAVQQVGYVAVDAAVSKVADKISQLEPIKRVIASEPIDYISKNISAENKKFLKDQAIVATSAIVMNAIYKGLRGTTDASLYQNGIASVVANTTTFYCVGHFVTLPLVTKYMDNCGTNQVASLATDCGIAMIKNRINNATESCCQRFVPIP